MTSGLLFQKPSLLVCLCVRFMLFIILSIGNETRNISSTRYIDQDDLVCNKPKGRISKRVFQENKARQIFPKNEISHPLIRTRTCVYQGVRNVCFSENLACFVFLNHRFDIRPFGLLANTLQTGRPFYHQTSWKKSALGLEAFGAST